MSIKFIKNNPVASVMIVNWNGAVVLDRCLKALSAQTYRHFEVILVDNASNDNSLEFLRKNWRDVQVIPLPSNTGFAKANNIGANKAQGDWLVFLNNDAFPRPDWLGNLLQAAAQNPEYSFFASKIIKADNNALFDGAGDIFHVSGLAWRRFYNQPVSEVKDRFEAVFSPCAAAGMYKRDAFFAAGGFDEDFVSFHEDVDLGFRLRLLGHRCLYVPDAIVEHIGSASYGYKSDLSVYYGHRNLVWSFIKNMPSPLFWVYLPAHLTQCVFFLLYYSLRGKYKSIWRSKWDAILGVKQMLRKRRHIQAHRKCSINDISIAMDHNWIRPFFKDFHYHIGK